MANESNSFSTLSDLITKSAVRSFEEAASAGIIEAEKEFRATVDLAIAEFQRKTDRAVSEAKNLAKKTANSAAVHILTGQQLNDEQKELQRFLISKLEALPDFTGGTYVVPIIPKEPEPNPSSLPTAKPLRHVTKRGKEEKKLTSRIARLKVELRLKTKLLKELELKAGQPSKPESDL